jgi:hypothetical protein
VRFIEATSLRLWFLRITARESIEGCYLTILNEFRFSFYTLTTSVSGSSMDWWALL